MDTERFSTKLWQHAEDCWMDGPEWWPDDAKVCYCKSKPIQSVREWWADRSDLDTGYAAGRSETIDAKYTGHSIRGQDN